jgi:hypothetical protein
LMDKIISKLARTIHVARCSHPMQENGYDKLDEIIAQKVLAQLHFNELLESAKDMELLNQYAWGDYSEDGIAKRGLENSLYDYLKKKYPGDKSEGTCAHMQSGVRIALREAIKKAKNI